MQQSKHLNAFVKKNVKIANCYCVTLFKQRITKTCFSGNITSAMTGFSCKLQVFSHYYWLFIMISA